MTKLKIMTKLGIIKSRIYLLYMYVILKKSQLFFKEQLLVTKAADKNIFLVSFPPIEGIKILNLSVIMSSYKLFYYPLY